MKHQKTNAGLQRVAYELRAKGVRQEGRNPLRSGIHTRGYLPHVKREGSSYFVTFRLADSLPKEVLLQFKRVQIENLKRIQGDNKESIDEVNREFRRQVERYLDKGVGQCDLKRADVAEIVASALLHFHGQEYMLDEWVIMPNHVHVILWPMPNQTLSEILRGRKTFIARQANRILSRTGQPFWQHESYDHLIRSDEEKGRIRRYIRNNPVKVGLCEAPEDWPWGSARLRTQTGGRPAACDTAD